MSTPPSRLLYDAESAAELLSTTPRRIHELRRAGQLGAVKDGRMLKFRHEDLQNYADRLAAFEPGGA